MSDDRSPRPPEPIFRTEQQVRVMIFDGVARALVWIGLSAWFYSHCDRLAEVLGIGQAWLLPVSLLVTIWLHHLLRDVLK